MDLTRRTTAFLQLAERIRNYGKLQSIIRNAETKNPWFTQEHIQLAFEGLTHYLDENKLNTWLNRYDLSEIQAKNVGVVMAGNIPLVGIHDAICVLLSGHKLTAKLSSQDEVLMKYILEEIVRVDPGFADKIAVAERLTKVDAVIATGSDNTARYFNYYFNKIPHIIRKNRTSVAILDGTESFDDLEALGSDIFLYFGLGCRNVSKILIPENFDIQSLIGHWNRFRQIGDHHKYHNNYHYQRSVFLMNQTPHVDNGFVLMHKHTNLVSPIGVVYYDYYKNIEEINLFLDQYSDKIQCIVSNLNLPGKVCFGKAQMPDIDDFADHIDTMEFLTHL